MITEPNDYMKEIYNEIGPSDFNQDVHDWLSTGVLPLNKVVSGKYDGGIPVGRISILSGSESSGKTLLATMVAIETQRKGGIVVFLDFEHAFSIERAKKMGLSVDPNEWIYKQPDSAEDGFKLIEKVVKIIRNHDSNKFVTVIVDSVARMPTMAEIDADYDELNMKTNLSLAQTLARCLKKITPVINKTNTTLLLINQLRDSLNMYGPKDSVPGGRALKHDVSLHIKISKGKKIEVDKEIVGEFATAETIKNKVYAPFRKCEYRGSFEEGIDLIGTHIDYASKIGMFGGSSGFILWKDKKRRPGELAKIFRANPDQYEEFLALFTDEVIDPETGEVTNV